jgi:hypothetical protein
MMIGFHHADRETKRDARRILARAGQAIEQDAAARIAPKDARSASGYRTSVRQRGIVVRQSLRKTTGLHPEWGAYQMRHGLIPPAVRRCRKRRGRSNTPWTRSPTGSTAADALDPHRRAEAVRRPLRVQP